MSAPDRDAGDSLELLSLFHYALGALVGMLSLVPGLYLFVGVALADAAVEPTVRTQAAAALHVATIVVAVAALLGGLAFGALLVFAGRCLHRRRRWRLCRAVALLACLIVPVGTLLGVISLVTISRPEVRAQFA